MLERLKRHPLIGISLAVACGLVLAHIINALLDNLWDYGFEGFLQQTGWPLFGWGVAAGLVFLTVWRRRLILGWFDSGDKFARRRKGAAVAAFSLFAIYIAVIMLSGAR